MLSKGSAARHSVRHGFPLALRAALLARSRLLLCGTLLAGTPPTYTDPDIVAGVTSIKAIHPNELRTAVRE